MSTRSLLLADLGFVIGSIDIVVRSLVRNDFSRHSDHNRIVGHIFCDDAIRADGDMIAHAHGADDFGSGAYMDVIPDRRVAPIFSLIGLRQGNALKNVAVFAYFTIRIYDDPPKVTDEKAAAYVCGGRDRDAEFEDVSPQHQVGEGPKDELEHAVLLGVPAGAHPEIVLEAFPQEYLTGEGPKPGITRDSI